jgi:bifunctional non-homologous end joining protein LigD
MAKRADSIYRPGRRTDDWLKIKTSARQEAIIGGFTEPKGGRQHIGALVLGVYRDGTLRYVGHAGGGIPPEQLAPLRKKLERLEQSRPPFAEAVKPNAPVHWVRPELVCEVSFQEWTADGRMRQPVFVGMRSDKSAQDVTVERPVDAPAVFGTEAPQKRSRHTVAFTHADQLFWPELGITKGDLLAYYEAVAPVFLPYLRDRPLSLLRHPDGYAGQSFFQKDMPAAPAGLPTATIYSDSTRQDVHYLVGGSLATLRYMVQLGSIEINPWNSRRNKLDYPDWAVIDLDPEGVDFEDVITVARAVKQVCDRYDIAAYPKTSGKTGIHIFIPLHAKYTYEQARQFGQLLATLVHQQLPDITSLERSPQKRRHKVYLDYLQNNRGQTLAAPYAVRPTAAASVSAPLRWDEVRPGLRPEQFTLQTMPERLKKIGDIWQPVRGKGIDLPAILRRMQ